MADYVIAEMAENWREFSKLYLESGEYHLEIEESTSTNRDMLNFLSYGETRDYCKYLSLKVQDDGQEQKAADILADAFAVHPEYYLYVLDEKYFGELQSLALLPAGPVKRAVNPEVIARAVSLGLAEVQTNGREAGIRFASDIKETLQKCGTKSERKKIWKLLGMIRQRVLNLIFVYGIIEQKRLYEEYCRVYGNQTEETFFYRCLYWHMKFAGMVQICKDVNSDEYVCLPEINGEKILAGMQKYAGNLDFKEYTREEIKNYGSDLFSQSENLSFIYENLVYGFELSEKEAGSRMADFYMAVMNGEKVPWIMENIFGGLPAEGGVSLTAEMWVSVASAMLEIRIPMLKYRSREDYAAEKGISPWTIDMTDEILIDVDTKDRHMYEFPEDVQEVMLSVAEYCCWPDLKKMLQYKEREKVCSEEFLYLLAQAHVSASEYDEAEALISELESSSERGADSAEILRDALEEVMDIADEELDDGFDPFGYDDFDPFGYDDFFQNETMQMIARPYVREGRKIGRNEPCPCGSGKKYKNCCGR